MIVKRALPALTMLVAGAAAGYYYGTSRPDARNGARLLDEMVQPQQSGRPLQPPEPSAGVAVPSAAVHEQIETLADVLELPSDFAETAALYALAARADEQALERLIAEADGIAHRGDRAAALGILFSRYGELDPEAALAHLDDTGIEPKGDLLFNLFNAWAKIDLDAAAAAVHRRPGRGQRQVANDAILRAYAEADAATRRAVAARLPDTSGGTPYSPDAIVGLAATDVDTAMAQALALPGGVRTQVVGTIGSSWAMRDPEAAYEYAKKIRDPAMQTWFKRGVYFRWAERDPQRVMRLLDEGIGREEQGLLINSALPGLARNDPQAAFGYTARIEDAAARDAAQRMVFETWASDDPAAAADAVAATTDRELRSRLAAQVALYVVRERGERALEWAAEMDGGEGAAWTKTLETLAQQDARRAFEIAAATTTNGRARAVSAVIGSIATRDPEAAALYWQQLPANDDAGQEAAQQIAAHWVQRDSPAAERWVLGLLPGPTRDAALFGLLTGDTGDADPLRAAELINAIQNEGRRASMASMQIRRSLDAGDRNGAETLLQQVATDFPTREAFRRQIDEFQRENR